MLRGLSIVICSLLLAAGARAQQISPTWDCSTVTTSGRNISGAAYRLADGRWVAPGFVYQNGGYRLTEWSTFDGSKTSATPPPVSWMTIAWRYLTGAVDPCSYQPYQTFDPGALHPDSPAPVPSPSPSPTPMPSPSPTPRPVAGVVSGEYLVQLGPEYEGMRIDVLDAAGNVVDSVIVPEQGTLLQGEVELFWYEGDEALPPVDFKYEVFRPSIEGQNGGWLSAGLFDAVDLPLDEGGGGAIWQEAGEVAPQGVTYTEGGRTYVSNGNGTWVVTGPAFGGVQTRTITASKIYGGGQWSLVNASGGVIATGVIPVGGGSISTDVVLLPGETAEFVFQPIVIGGDGTPSLGQPNPVGGGTSTPVGGGTTSGGGSVVVPPEPPPADPGPIPEASPVPSPTIIGGGTGPEDPPVDVEVGTLELGETDDGEEEVLETAADIGDLMREAAANLGTAEANFQNAAKSFEALRLSGIGSNCTFSFGPANITLQTDGAVRSGLKLLILGCGAFAVAGLIRNALQ